MAAQPAPAVAETNDDRRNAFANYSLVNHDPRDELKFCPEVTALTGHSRNLFNAAAQITDQDAILHFEDVDADGYTDENVKQAVAMIFTKLRSLYGPAVSDKIMQRLPQRVYQSGLHSASNAKTRLASWDDAGAERAAFLAHATDDVLRANGIDDAQMQAFRDESQDFIPYGYFRTAMNTLEGKISKKMIIRIITHKLYYIHRTMNINKTMPNIFMQSIEKFGLDDELEEFPDEWAYFGADMHPQLKGKNKTLYTKLRKRIFEEAKEAAEAPPGVTTF